MRGANTRISLLCLAPSVVTTKNSDMTKSCPIGQLANKLRPWKTACLFEISVLGACERNVGPTQEYKKTHVIRENPSDFIVYVQRAGGKGMKNRLEPGKRGAWFRIPRKFRKLKPTSRLRIWNRYPNFPSLVVQEIHRNFLISRRRDLSMPF
jgi:hypothetical protein